MNPGPVSQHRPAPGYHQFGAMAVTVHDVLATPVLRDARVVAGEAGTAAREVRWTAVIEWPVEDFVRPGDFVLTTGLTCDAERFAQLALEIADSGAAALCVSLHESAALQRVPAAVVALADERAFPVIQVPWQVRFAEIMMAVTDQVIARQYAAVLEEPDRLLDRFTAPVLAGTGLAAVAEALERMLQRAAIILDSDLRAVAHGSLAAARYPDELRTWSDDIEHASAGEINRLRKQLDGGFPHTGVEIPGAGVGPGVVVAASARRGTLGYIYVEADGDAPVIPSLEGRAIGHAAIAVAMEMLRLRAAAEAETRVRGGFLWNLALGKDEDRQQVAATAALLGYDLRVAYNVAVARINGDPASAPARAERFAAHLEEASDRQTIVTRQAEHVLLLRHGEDRVALRAILETWTQAQTERASWGIAQEAVTLLDLDAAYRDALRALEVGAVVYGAGTVADAYELGPYLLLDVLSQDASSIAASRAVLAPVLDYDSATARDLLGTLEVYLRENGNTSAAARILYLNRHSLTYRLRKIESLTGRSLESYEDRFMLDLSAKVLRLVDRRAGEPRR